MKKLRLLVPVALIVAVVLLMMAPAAALAAPNQHGGGHKGWNGDRNGGWNGDCYSGCYNDWNDDCNGGFTYKVRRGDTLGDIGWRYGSSALELARVNHVHNPNLIYPGQRLWVPSNCW